MKRRTFVKGTTAALTLPFWLQGCKSLFDQDFPVHVHSDYQVGHLIMDGQSWPRVLKEPTDVAIVGGGIAGLSAAYGLKGKKFQLYELSDRFAGTSGAQEYNGIFFSQGAHYDLAYPNYYGEEVLKMMENLDLIVYEPWKKMWSFKDRQHLIPYTRRQQCFDHGEIRSEVLPEGSIKNQFLEILEPYLGQMPLPTRLISDELHYLNDITFMEFLMGKMEVPDSFKQQLDYHMMDDWGGRSDQVSALAGIHYFMCRPYYRQSVDLFSPPSGNDYFAQRILGKLPSAQVNLNHLVSRIDKMGNGFKLEILDIQQKQTIVIDSDQVIYAGQKQALKYLYPKEANLFDLEQTPWMVINFISEDDPEEYGFWQNEFLGENPAFLGFVDSSVQDRSVLKGKRVITAYYCLKPADREYLTTIPDHKTEIAAETLGYIQEMLQTKLEVEACFINVMGHAMAIPKPGFLFNDANDKEADLIYAGVDNGRLPLLFDALDSGLMAGSRATT